MLDHKILLGASRSSLGWKGLPHLREGLEGGIKALEGRALGAHVAGLGGIELVGEVHGFSVPEAQFIPEGGVKFCVEFAAARTLGFGVGVGLVNEEIVGKNVVVDSRDVDLVQAGLKVIEQKCRRRV